MADDTQMTHAAGATALIEEIRSAIMPTEVWAVGNAAEDAYCIEFTRSNSLNPKHECEIWLSKQDPRWVERNGYQVVRYERYKPSEALALKAATVMEALLRESVVSTERRSNVPNGVDEMNIAESGER